MEVRLGGLYKLHGRIFRLQLRNSRRESMKKFTPFASGSKKAGADTHPMSNDVDMAKEVHDKSAGCASAADPQSAGLGNGSS